MHCPESALACLHLLLKVKINVKDKVKLQFQRHEALNVEIISLYFMLCLSRINWTNEHSLWTSRVLPLAPRTDDLTSLNLVFLLHHQCFYPSHFHRPWLCLSTAQCFAHRVMRWKALTEEFCGVVLDPLTCLKSSNFGPGWLHSG